MKTKVGNPPKNSVKIRIASSGNSSSFAEKGKNTKEINE